MRLIKFDLQNILLLLAFIALPVAGLMLHLKLHPDLTYLTYILWFDIIIISILYLFDKTRFYGFVLNTVFFAVGVIMHIIYVPGGGITDILLSIPDFSIGFVLWRMNKFFGEEKVVDVKTGKIPIETKKVNKKK